MKNGFLFILLFSLSWALYAQQPEREIRVLDEVEQEFIDVQKAKRKAKIPSNIIKFSFLSPIRGEYGILYERRIKPWLSVQVGVGGTHKDMVHQRFTSSTFNSPDFKPIGGFSARAGLRFYPIADGWMGGLFFSPDFVYRSYRFRANLTQFDTENNPSPQKLTTGYSFMEYRLLVGHSYDYIFRNFYLEYYVGLVFRDIMETVPEYQNNAQGAYYTRTGRTTFTPGIAFNATVGYSF